MRRKKDIRRQNGQGEGKRRGSRLKLRHGRGWDGREVREEKKPKKERKNSVDLQYKENESAKGKEECGRKMVWMERERKEREGYRDVVIKM